MSENPPVFDASELWKQVLAALPSRGFATQTIATLLGPLEPMDAVAGVFLLCAPNDFSRDWVSKSYASTIEDQLAKITGQPWSLRWTVAGTAKTPPPAPPTQKLAPPRPRPAAAPRAASTTAFQPATPAPAQRAPMGAVASGLHPRLTFEHFVIGPSNELAYRAAEATAGLSGRRFNPLFLCGGTGLGKTHLVNAVGHRVLEQKPDARIVYVSAEHFMNEFVAAIQGRRMDEFRERYRNQCDVLLLDDVQFFAGKDGLQEEFFHTFNALHMRDRPIVLTSDVLPDRLQGMAERLLSRFSSGMVAEVYSPQMETRVAILRKKAELENVFLDDAAAMFIATVATTNVRDLEGLLLKLALKASIEKRTGIDEDFARQVLRVPARVAPRATVDDVQKVVCEHYRVRPAQLVGKERHKEVMVPRQVAMYLCRAGLGTSFPQIGAKFGGKDHTTVMSAVKKMEKLLPDEPDLRREVESLAQKLGLTLAPPDGAPA